MTTRQTHHFVNQEEVQRVQLDSTHEIVDVIKKIIKSIFTVRDWLIKMIVFVFCLRHSIIMSVFPVIVTLTRLNIFSCSLFQT